MAANATDATEHEREQPRLSAPMVNGPRELSRFLDLEVQYYSMRIRSRELTFTEGEAYDLLSVVPCESAAVMRILDLKTSGKICEDVENILLCHPFYNGIGIHMAFAHFERDVLSELGHDFNLPKTALGSLGGPKFRRIISEAYKLTPSDFAVPSTVVLMCKDVYKSAHGYYLTNTSTGSTGGGPKFLFTGGSCKLMLPEFAGTSTLGSRLKGMMPLTCAVDALLMAGGSSAQTGPDHHGMRMVEPENLIFDSGASNHVVREETLLQWYQILPRPWHIEVADGYPLEVVGVGSIVTKAFFIPKVYRVKGLKSNLISVSQLARDHGLLSVFDGVKCEVLKRDWTTRVGEGVLKANGMYELRSLMVPAAGGSN